MDHADYSDAPTYCDCLNHNEIRTRTMCTKPLPRYQMEEVKCNEVSRYITVWWNLNNIEKWSGDCIHKGIPSIHSKMFQYNMEEVKKKMHLDGSGIWNLISYIVNIWLPNTNFCKNSVCSIPIYISGILAYNITPPYFMK